MQKVLIIGANDAATATAIRLFRAGFAVTLVSEIHRPDLFQFRNFSAVLAAGSKMVEELKAISFDDYLCNHTTETDVSIKQFVTFCQQNKWLPVLGVNDFKQLSEQDFDTFVVCDEYVYKRCELNVMIQSFVKLSSLDGVEAALTVCDSGDNLGQVMYPFLEDRRWESKTKDSEMSLYASKDGLFITEKNPGDACIKNEKIAIIDGKPVNAEHDAVLTGVLPSGLLILQGSEIARFSKAALQADVRHLPKEARAIGGGVLEAILFARNM